MIWAINAHQPDRIRTGYDLLEFQQDTVDSLNCAFVAQLRKCTFLTIFAPTLLMGGVTPPIKSDGEK